MRGNLFIMIFRLCNPPVRKTSRQISVDDENERGVFLDTREGPREKVEMHASPVRSVQGLPKLKSRRPCPSPAKKKAIDFPGRSLRSFGA